MRIVPLMLLAMALPSVMRGQEKPAVPEVAAIGHAEVKIRPDRATIVVGVETRDETARLAGAANATLIQKILSAVRQFGIPDTAVATARYSVRPQSDMREATRGDIRNYIAFNSIQIRLTRLDRLGALIDTILSAGATNVSNIELESSEQPAARRRALAAAVANAKADAAAMASALGGRLGAPIQISTDPEPRRFTADGFAIAGFSLGASARAAGTAIVTPDELTITATVRGRWHLEGATR